MTSNQNGRPWIVNKSGFYARLYVKDKYVRCFYKAVSVDVLYLKINDVLEYNMPYVQSDFMSNLGQAIKMLILAMDQITE